MTKLHLEVGTLKMTKITSKTPIYGFGILFYFYYYYFIFHSGDFRDILIILEV